MASNIDPWWRVVAFQVRYKSIRYPHRPVRAQRSKKIAYLLGPVEANFLNHTNLCPYLPPNLAGSELVESLQPLLGLVSWPLTCQYPRTSKRKLVTSCRARWPVCVSTRIDIDININMSVVIINRNIKWPLRPSYVLYTCISNEKKTKTCGSNWFMVQKRNFFNNKKIKK